MATINGTASADSLTGGADNDSISGFDGADTLSGLGGNDTLNGGTGADSLFGGVGNDLLVGGDANDTLIGATGFDIVQGGLGDDTYILEDNDFVFEGADGGVDVVRTAIATYVLAANVEGLVGTGPSQNLTGNDLNNHIGAVGAATVFGADGNDEIFIQGDGGFEIEGGAGDDSVFIFMAGGVGGSVDGGEGYDTVALNGDAAFFRFDPEGRSFERLELYGRLFGTSGNDILGLSGVTVVGDIRVYTGEGHDVVYGAQTYANVIDGGAGNDTLTGGARDDSIDGGAGSDRVSGNGGDDTLIGAGGVDSLTGGDGADQLWFRSDADGAADGVSLSGGNGSDLFVVGEAGGPAPIVIALSGGKGLDLFRADGPVELSIVDFGDVEQIELTAYNDLRGTSFSDTVDFAKAELVGPITGTSFDAGGGDDRIAGFLDELNNLIGGTGNDTLTGGALNDYLQGDAGRDLLQGGVDADTLVGGDGADSLVGGAGDDNLQGGAGNDTLDGSEGDDRLNGGPDTDTVTYARATAAVTVSLQTQSVPQNTGGAGFDILNDFSGLIGSAFDDVLSGSNFTVGNRLEGLKGADVLLGLAYDDTLIGGDGADQLDGGIDVDTLRGDAGADTLVGGSGGDQLTGGQGADRFVYLALSDSAPAFPQQDTITDFNRRQGDRIDLSALDADSTADGEQAFTWIDGFDFSGAAGELRQVEDGRGVFLEADVDGDGIADFGVFVIGGLLRGADFAL